MPPLNLHALIETKYAPTSWLRLNMELIRLQSPLEATGPMADICASRRLPYTVLVGAGCRGPYDSRSVACVMLLLSWCWVVCSVFGKMGAWEKAVQVLTIMRSEVGVSAYTFIPCAF